MAVCKRGKWYWMHDFVSGVEYRMALKTGDWREARKLHKEKLNEIAEGIGSVGKVARQTFEVATDVKPRTASRKRHGSRPTSQN